MYKFIIDTDQYAGNFERELTAYCTGIVGDCHVGEEFLDEKISPGIFDNVLDLFENAVEMVPDEEYGYMRSTTIYPTPGYYNDGKGNHIKGEPPKGQEGYTIIQQIK